MFELNDTSPVELNDTSPVEVLTGRDKLRYLSKILRHRLWPQGFVAWNYEDCKTCAIEVAALLWNIQRSSVLLSEFFEITSDVTDYIFFNANADNQRRAEVTPEQVADAIDKYLNRTERKL